jgi:LysM domain
MTKITCPVCDRPEVETNLCPNCETDLSSFKILLELPTSISVNKSKFFTKALPSLLAIAILIIGIIVGYVSHDLMSESDLFTAISLEQQNLKNPAKISKIKSHCEDVFYYKVQKEDYLWLIAERIYGNGNFYPVITQANSSLRQRQNNLIVGEILIIPNLKDNCRGYHESNRKN